MKFRIYRATYSFVATWLVTASLGRIALSLQHGVPLDPLPFVSIALGILMFFTVGWSKSDTISVSRNPAHNVKDDEHG